MEIQGFQQQRQYAFTCIGLKPLGCINEAHILITPQSFKSDLGDDSRISVFPFTPFPLHLLDYTSVRFWCGLMKNSSCSRSQHSTGKGEEVFLPKLQG